MTSRLKNLLERQQRLIAKSAEQRASIVASLEVWEKPIAWLDRGMGIIGLIQKNRVFLYAAFALLASYKPAGTRKAVVYAASALKLAHQVRDLITSRPSPKSEP